MGLIDKFKESGKNAELQEELKAKLSNKKNVPVVEKKIAEKIEIVENANEEEVGDDLELFVKEFFSSYPKIDKKSRLIRIQYDNFEALAKLKIHNISISEFVNFAICNTLKSEEYKKIIKIIKSIKNKK